MAKKPPTYEELKQMAGQELGVSRWVVVDQAMIQQFADCTGDRQWIHVDAERARRESPFRKTIAHGYLTLSLVGALEPADRRLSREYAGRHQLRAGQGALPCAGHHRRAGQAAHEDDLDRGQGPGAISDEGAEHRRDRRREKPALIAETLVMLYERRRRRPA